jgi:peptidoglycan/xylan/chitin deacetylase (PgdA/CDA1 family)
MPTDSSYIDLKSAGPSWTEGLLVLMYHLIDTPPLRHPWRGLYVEPSTLRAQLRELKASGVRPVSLTEWNRDSADARQVVVTFDDAFQCVLRSGLPVLQELAVPAITYVVAGLIGRTNVWDEGSGAKVMPLMQRLELVAWLEAGHEIGSHGMTHRELTKISPEEARQEIFESKKILEDIAGRTIRHFCYPYGTCNPMLREMVMEAGYETAATTEPGINSSATDPFSLHRLLATHRRPYLAALRGSFFS